MILPMPRVSEIGDEAASAAQRQLFARDREIFGEVLVASRVYAHQPEVFLRVQALHAALAETSSLPVGLVSRARLRVAELRDSPF